MPRNDARLLARITWFAGVVIFGIGLVSGHDAMLIFAGLAISGATIAPAIAER
jgi:hypothetical protein